ncbi:MAG: hypothetical protein JEZ07_18620 [Phycisphaerae bacterium]|nr:hypothetical protein [Phycisphaerae bacterium]
MGNLLNHKAGYLLITLLLYLNSIASALVKNDFVGAWLNEDPDTQSITRSLISAEVGNYLGIHNFGKCSPIDCDWGKVIANYTGNAFTAVYSTPFTTKTMTISLNKALNRLHINTVTSRIGLPDFTSDDYFYKMTKPDLVIRDITMPTGPVTYQQSPSASITFMVHNLGAPGITTQPLRARIVNATKDGELHTFTGYFSIDYTNPLSTDDSTSCNFLVGHDSVWQHGAYTLQFEVDQNDFIDEEVEDNNISYTVNLQVLNEHDLSGLMKFNYTSMHYITDATPTFSFVSGGNTLNDVDTYYYNTTSRYAFDNLPENELVYYYATYHITGTKSTLPGNYKAYMPVNLSSLTDTERENFTIQCYEIMHMTQPWDNNNADKPTGTAYYDILQPGMIFEWDAIANSDHYEFTIDKYRDSEHPSGFGYISSEISLNTPDSKHYITLPVTGEHEHYQAKIKSYDASGNLNGQYLTTYTNGHSVTYRFKVDFNCYPELPRIKAQINKKTTSGGYDRYYLAVPNADVIPAELFTKAPDLPPAGLNQEASRTWVYIKDDSGNQLAGYVAVYHPQDLNGLWFGVPEGTDPPQGVYIELHDRRCEMTYRSSYADPYMPCPVADINGDCIVNLLDFGMLANQWLNVGDM